MSSFTSPLKVTPLDDGVNWKLIAPFDYHVGDLSSTEVITVPVGFVTDFTTIPRIFWSVLPVWQRYGKAAVLHDFLYTAHLYSRKRSDQIFREAMEVLNVPCWQIRVMYYAVRLLGKKNYEIPLPPAHIIV